MATFNVQSGFASEEFTKKTISDFYELVNDYDGRLKLTMFVQKKGNYPDFSEIGFTKENEFGSVWVCETGLKGAIFSFKSLKQEERDQAKIDLLVESLHPAIQAAIISQYKL